MLAEAPVNPMLADGHIALIGLALAALVLSIPGLFASDKTLVGMAPLTGTKNPKVARVACVIGLVLGLSVLILEIALQTGLLG
jgi:hypothetical protein